MASDKEVKKTFVEFRLDGLNTQFKEQARLFNVMMGNGGIQCVAMLDCIRQLQFLYLDIAAHKHVLDSIEGSV